MMRVFVVFFLLAAVGITQSSTVIAQSANEPKADAYPIASELFGEPGLYAGKSIVIYGLVIEVSPKGFFFLQDVSQHPIKIVLQGQAKPKIGDQVLVSGIFKSSPVPHVRAKSIVRTKVLGGGGCC